jgi:TRAP-type C4-dicarboxylate transport system substrate-binding protein
MASKTDNDFGAPFSPETATALSHRKDQVDLAGQAILSLLEKAADAAEDNNRRAAETAQKLSTQLRAAEARIAELEAENQLYRERSERAEDWLRRIYSEIQESFIQER